MKILGQFPLIIMGWAYGLEMNLDPISEEGKGVFSYLPYESEGKSRGSPRRLNKRPKVEYKSRMKGQATCWKYLKRGPVLHYLDTVLKNWRG